MYTIPKIKPLENLEVCYQTLDDIYIYKENNWAIGQLYPNGGADGFTYFFAIRNIPIFNYLRGNISLGEYSAYDKNINSLKSYINWQIDREINVVNDEMAKILVYKEKNWAIGELYPDAGPDEFVVFFGERGLEVVPYLRGTVSIGEPTAYCDNIDILIKYLEEVRAFREYISC